MAQNARPPTPGPFIQPNYLAVMEAVATVAFPISKRELLDQVGEETVILQGRNVSLHDLIKDVHDDYFDSEDELLGAIEAEYTAAGTDETEGGTLPTGPQDSWQSRISGSADSAGASTFTEPQG